MLIFNHWWFSGRILAWPDLGFASRPMQTFNLFPQCGINNIQSTVISKGGSVPCAFKDKSISATIGISTVYLDNEHMAYHFNNIYVTSCKIKTI